MIKYTTIGGALPFSLFIDENTGAIAGDISFQNIEEGPVWVGPAAGQLGDYAIDEVIEPIQFDVSIRPGGPELSHVSVVMSGTDSFPWGLELDTSTGVLSGTIAPLKSFQVEKFDNANPPVWTTSSGSLGDFDENQTITEIQIEATPYLTRTVQYNVTGSMPWGLFLDQTTGKITGKVSELKIAPMGIEVPKTPLPVWSTVGGRIGDIREGDSLTTSIAATVASGRTLVNYVIIKGFIAPGFFLNPSTGEITGTATEIRLSNESEFVEPLKNPTISPTVKINNVDTTPSGGVLGTFTKGNVINIKFTPVVVSERTFSKFVIAIGILPWGLLLDASTGELSGTIPSDTTPGTYNFTLKVVDSTESWTTTNYTFTVQ